ncbi:hypothetical protein D046_1079B, partial [Vibrio parahaemolyticus V-223/04]
STEMAR